MTLSPTRRGGLRLRGLPCATRMVLQTLVLPARQQPQPLGAVLAGMLVMVTQTIHVLVPPRALAHGACERTQTALGLALDFARVGLGEVALGR